MMTQQERRESNKWSFTQWMKIFSIVGATITFGVQSGKGLNILKEMYLSNELRARDHERVDAEQTRVLLNTTQRLNAHDSMLFSHEHRIGISESDINILQLHDPKSKYNIK